MHQKNNKNNVLIISNIISWCICLIPLVLIFSNSIADIIAVNGDPLDNISVLEDIDFVMKEGVIFKSP